MNEKDIQKEAEEIDRDLQRERMKKPSSTSKMFYVFISLFLAGIIFLVYAFWQKFKTKKTPALSDG